MLCYKCLVPVEKNDAVLSGLHRKCFLDWFQIRDNPKFAQVAAKNVSNEPFVELNSSFFHGKFKKYSAVLDGKSYILKVQEKDFPELPATEYLCNQLAKDVGLLIPDFFLIRFEETVETFVSENFMAKHQTANMVHIYHFLHSPEDFSCESILKVIENKTGRLEDLERFIELTLFDALIGNHDRHGRNLALIETRRGFQLAPFYDNPTVLGTEIEALLGAHQDPRGKIYTSSSTEPILIDYIKEWSRLGYREVVDKFRDKVNIDQMNGRIDSSFISLKRKKAIRSLILRRHAELVQ